MSDGEWGFLCWYWPPARKSSSISMSGAKMGCGERVEIYFWGRDELEGRGGSGRASLL